MLFLEPSKLVPWAHSPHPHLLCHNTAFIPWYPWSRCTRTCSCFRIAGCPISTSIYTLVIVVWTPLTPPYKKAGSQGTCPSPHFLTSPIAYIPWYPGVQEQAPVSGWHDAPFWQVHWWLQFGPHMLSAHAEKE